MYRFLSLLTFFVLLPTLARSQTSIGASNRMQFTVKTVDNVQWITLTGPIDVDDGFYFNSFAEAHLNYDLPTVFDISSPGGIGLATRDLIVSIDEINKTIRRNGKDVWAYVSDKCSSACAMLFMSFNNRAMAPTGKIGFHGAQHFGSFSSGGTADYLSYLLERGVSINWINKNLGIFATTNMTFYSPQHLLREETGILRNTEDILTPEALIVRFRPVKTNRD